MRRKGPEKIAEELDALGFMPERFITAYLELVRSGMNVSVGAAKYDEHVAAAVKKRFHEHAGGLRDEKMLRFKAWIDRRLREIGRDMQVYLNAREEVVAANKDATPAMKRAARRIAKELEKGVELKCTNEDCKKYVSWQWAFCAWCGREVNRGRESAREALAEAHGAGGVEQLPREEGSNTHREDASCPGCGVVSTWEHHRCQGQDSERREDPGNAEDAVHHADAVISET